MSKSPTTLAMGPLECAEAVFREMGITDPARDVREIFAGVLAVEPADAWRHRERIGHPRIAEAFGAGVERRRAGEPLAYVIGCCGFRFLDLAVDRSTLIPRPETEGLVGAALQWAGRRAEGWGTALELGTGSGCIALSLWAEGEFASVVATEISEAALNVAHGNAMRAGATIDFRLGSWFQPVRGETFSLVVSNPPYVSTSDYDRLDRSVRVFTTASIRGILHNPFYAGKIKHHDELLPGFHEALVSEDLFQAVQIAMKRNSGRSETLQSRPDREYLLKGSSLISCRS